ncbi:protein lin-54 homolog isoform X2 [Limulus polyphemus]|uniref:Protein lin-54 homolog isoform X2 n=1 Tax=Limulus polyphemus TaxID=6850 RepID=A0ABM1S8R5_LIMPO|nr:protein lin-54 homolog isoform X2 [Limulus polyphemus]
MPNQIPDPTVEQSGDVNDIYEVTSPQTSQEKAITSTREKEQKGVSLITRDLIQIKEELDDFSHQLGNNLEDSKLPGLTILAPLTDHLPNKSVPTGNKTSFELGIVQDCKVSFPLMKDTNQVSADKELVAPFTMVTLATEMNNSTDNVNTNVHFSGETLPVTVVSAAGNSAVNVNTSKQQVVILQKPQPPNHSSLSVSLPTVVASFQPVGQLSKPATLVCSQPSTVCTSTVYVPLTVGKNSEKIVVPHSTVTIPQQTPLVAQTAPKRPCLMPSGQSVTKIMLSKNSLVSNQSGNPVAVAVTNVATGSITSQQHTILLASPGKSYSVTKPITSTGPSVMRGVTGNSNKQGFYLLSPVKSPGTKVTMIPVSLPKSPQKIAPAPACGTTSNFPRVAIATAIAGGSTPTVTTTCTVAKQTTMPATTTKVLWKTVVPATVKSSTSAAGSVPQTIKLVAASGLPQVLMKPGNLPASNLSGPGASPVVCPIQVPGSKFPYVRLVTASTQQTSVSTVVTPRTATVGPVSGIRSMAHSAQVGTSTVQTVGMSSNQLRFAVPIVPAISGHSQIASKPSSSAQRVLFPATTVTTTSQVHHPASNSTLGISQLTPGTSALLSGSNNMTGLVVLPAQYLTQVQQGQQVSSGALLSTNFLLSSGQGQNILPVPVSANTETPNSHQQAYIPIAAATAPPQGLESVTHQSNPIPAPSRHQVNGVALDCKERRPCNCNKSQCLKLYCDCFANGKFCNSCNCANCYNNLDHEEERQKAIRSCLERNPMAFHPKIGKSKEGDQERRHTKGCNCKRSGCLKNYCECYEAKILCTNLCKCVGCKNFEDSSERKTLMHLADAAEFRVQQQAVAKTKISSQLQDLPIRPPISASGERLPFSFVKQEVIEATCHCLLAQASDGEESQLTYVELEKLVVKEFGRCLMQIIETANQTKDLIPET